MNKINYYKELIEKKLDEYLQVVYPDKLFESMRYTVMLSGKRIRPILCLETCAMLGGDIEKAVASACAIEILHSQTLILDDLPCMDNDDYRRGKLTNHKVFGEAMSILAADSLKVFAPELIVKNTDLSPDVILKILEEYFKYSGAKGVIAGQVVDIESENNPDINDKVQTLNYIHTHKTSDLFQLAIRCGAIIAGVDDERLADLTEFAKMFGLAFQVCDDILDEISSFEDLGKTIGKDKNSAKLTYVSLYGLESAKCKLSCLINDCRDIMCKHGFKSEIFSQMLDDLGKRAKI